MRVELDVYSGRPNPSFELEGRDVPMFEELARELPRRVDDSELPGLGYRGFIVHLPAPLRVFGAPEVERWLLERAKSRLDPALVEAVAERLRGLST